MHHITRENPCLENVSTARQAENLLRKTLGSYNKSKLKSEKFPLKRVVQAIVEAREIDESVNGGDIPDANTSRVYQLWQSIIRNSSPAQVPEELRKLRKP